ncbi:MAG TPA: glycosyltransferase family 39 protein [Kofleriaceae bacterium]|nr:glycosyltransferase family 39 protein [Kofleriaceae bacterium]
MADASRFAARARAFAHHVPVDVAGFVVIALAIVVTHVRFIRHGMCWNDPSWFFHFGHRALHGDVPYRDYVFQVGPLPIYVDAGFQELFGAKYIASVYAGVAIKILRVFVAWAIVRRLVSGRAAAAFAVWCALDPLFAFVHHWSTAYSQLFITLAGLCLLLASRAHGRRELVLLALAGLSAGAVVSARQSSAVMIGVVLFASTAVMAVRRHYFTAKKFAALWGGFAAALVLVFGALALAGALGPAIQQMFLDAPQKKAVTGLDAILDAISGGALVTWDFSWWGGFLFFLGLPIAIVAGAVLLVRRDRPISTATIGLVALPIGLVLATLVRDASFNVFNDAPRIFFTVTTVLAVLWPDRLRAWFGMEPIVAIGLGALPLASDWALEMSFPGRGWGDGPSLVVGVLLFTCASSRLSRAAKSGMCWALAAMGVLSFVLLVRAGFSPFAKAEATDGTLHESRLRVQNPIMRGLAVNLPRKTTLDWLSSYVHPHSTCFIYANLPVLYDLLRCTNPTRIDTTAADFITADDANAAIEALRRAPPDFIIAQDKQWMSPPLDTDLGGDLTRYDGLNPRASMAIHVGLRSLLDQYESVGRAADVLGPDLAKQASEHWDVIDGLRLYRRKP